MKTSKDVMICSLFICNYISSFLTPIQLLIFETYQIFDPLSVILQLMDSFILLTIVLQLYYKSLSFITKYETMLMIASTSTALMISVILVFKHSRHSITIFYALEYIRWLKIIYLPIQYNRISQVKQESFHYLYENIDTFLSFILVMMLYISTMACIWYGVASYQMNIHYNNGNGGDDVDTWIAYDEVLNIQSNVSRYFRSMHFVTQTLLGIGYGDIYPRSTTEILLTIFMILISILFYGYLISLIICILTDKDQVTKMLGYRLSLVKQYLNKHSIQPKSNLDIISYYRYINAQYNGISEECLLKLLPQQLMLEMKYKDCSKQVLLQIPFFQMLVINTVISDKNLTILSHIVMRLSFQLLHPNFHLASKYQSPLRQLIIIRKGCIEVSSFRGATQDTAVQSKYAGDYIGERCFLLGYSNNSLEEQIHSQDIIARIFSEIAILSYSDFIACLIDCKFITSELQYQNLVYEVTLEVSTTTNPLNEHVMRDYDLNYQQLRNALLVYSNTLSTCTIVVNKDNQHSQLQLQEQEYKDVNSILKGFELSNLIWWMLLCMTIFYYNLMVPIRIMLEYDETHLQSTTTSTTTNNHMYILSSTWNYFYVLDYFGDFIFIAEYSFHTWYNRNGRINSSDDNKLNTWQYYILLLIILPIDWLSIYSIGSLVYYRTSKIFSILLLPYYVSNIKHWFDKVHGKMINPEFITIFYLATCNLIAIVWITVGWNVLQIQTFLDDINNEADSLADKVFTICISSLYWCLTTVTTTGYGDIIPLTTAQTIFNVFISIIGPSIFVTIIAKLVSYIKREDILENNVQHRTTVLLQFLQQLSIPYIVSPPYTDSGGSSRVIRSPSKSAKITKMVKFHRNDLKINTEAFQYSNTNSIITNSSCKDNDIHKNNRTEHSKHYTIIKPSNLLQYTQAIKSKSSDIKSNILTRDVDQSSAAKGICIIKEPIVKRLSTKYYPWLISNPSSNSRIKPILTLNSIVQLRMQSKPSTARSPIRLKNMLKVVAPITSYDRKHSILKLDTIYLSSQKKPNNVALNKETSLLQRIQKKWSRTFSIHKDEIKALQSPNPSMKGYSPSTMLSIKRNLPFNMSFKSSFHINNLKKTSSYIKKFDQKFTELKSSLSFKIPDIIPNYPFSTISNVSKQLYQIAKDSLELFSQKHEMEQAVVEYYQYLAGIGISSVEEFAMPSEQSVHNHIRLLSRYAILYETIRKIKLFMNVDDYLLQCIINAMEQQFYCNKSTVLAKHQSIYGLYVIQKGNMEITSYYKGIKSSSTCADHSKYYQAKGYFGESSLLLEECSYSLEVTALDDCEVWFLSRHSFHNLLQQHQKKPEILHAMKQSAVLHELGIPGRIGREEEEEEDHSIGDEDNTSNNTHCNDDDDDTNTLSQSDRIIVDGNESTKLISEGQGEKEISTVYKLLYLSFNCTNHKPCLYGIQLLSINILKMQPFGIIIWSLFMAFFIVYNAFILILRICFFQSCLISYYYAIDYIADMFFLIDIIARWSYVSYHKQSKEFNNTLEKNITDSHVKLNRKQLLCYTISIIPFDFFIFLNSSILTLGPSQTLSVYRLNRLFRSIDFNIHFNVIADHIIQTCNHYFSSSFNLSSTIFPIIKLLAITFMTAHCFGSIFFLLANQQHLAGELDNWGDTALLFTRVQCQSTNNTSLTTVCNYNWRASTDDVINQYIHSFYWAITLLTTTGYGDIHPISKIEKGYNIILYVLGIIAYTLLITYLQEIMSGWDVTYGLFKQRMEIIDVFLLNELDLKQLQPQHRLIEYSSATDSTNTTPIYDNDDEDDDDDDSIVDMNVIKTKTLFSYVKKYYDHLWIMQRGLMHYEIQEYMPNRLYSATLLHILSKQMRSLFFIQQCSLEFQYAFLNKLKVHYYMKGDYVFHTGEIARSLYLLHTGEVTLISSEVNTEVRSTDISTSSYSSKRYSRFSTKLSTMILASRRSKPLNKTSKIYPIPPLKDKNFNLKSKHFSKVSNQILSSENIISSRSAANKHRASNNRLSHRISRMSNSLNRLSYLRKNISRLNNRNSTCYKTITEGNCIGTSEFFLKNVYTCTAKVTNSNISWMNSKDTICTFEIEYNEFYKLLVDFKLEHFYQQVLQQNEYKLQKHSTFAIVSKLNSNLNQLRLKRLLSLRVPYIPVIECYSETHIVYQLWNAFMLVLVMIVAIWIPYYMAFASSYPMKWQLLIDIFIIASYWVDIYLRMFMLSYLDGQISIREPLLVYRTYIRSSFLLDLISAIPFSLLVYAIFLNSFAYSIVRYILLIRLYRLPQLMYSLLKTRTKLIQFINEDLQRLLYIISVFLYTTHLSACILCYLGSIERTTTATYFSNTSWIVVNLLDKSTNLMIYLYAYYWTLYTLSTVGYGSLATHSNIERIYLLCIMIIGSLLCAMVSAIITSILEKNIQKKGDLRRNLYSMIKYCKSKNIDIALQTKIKSYYEYIQSQISTKNINGHKDFLLLPYIIRFQIIHLYYWNNIKNHCYLNTNYFDKTLQRGFLLSIIRELTLYTSIPGEILNQIDFNIRMYYHEDNKIESNQINMCNSYQIDRLFILRRGLCYTSACSMESVVYLRYLCPLKHILDYNDILNELNAYKSVEYDDQHHNNTINNTYNNCNNCNNYNIISDTNESSHSHNNSNTTNNKYNLNQFTNNQHNRNNYQNITKLIATSETYCHFYYISKENLLFIEELYKKSLLPIDKR